MSGTSMADTETMPFDPDAEMPVPYAPPREWFEAVPDWFDAKGGLIQIDPTSGRVAAIVAPYGECILDGTANCWTPPASKTAYEYAHVGSIVTDDGSTVRIANIGGGVPHANLTASSSVAADHYANTASRRMIGRYVDSPENGSVLFLGSMWPGTTNRDMIEVLASALSGDWRWIQSLNDYEMVGAQLVNNPGFRPIPAGISRQASVISASFVAYRPAVTASTTTPPPVIGEWRSADRPAHGELADRLRRLASVSDRIAELAVVDATMPSAHVAAFGRRGGKKPRAPRVPGVGPAIDGDGDKKVWDGTPAERVATPAEIRAGKLMRELQKKAKDTEAPSPEERPGFVRRNVQDFKETFLDSQVDSRRKWEQKQQFEALLATKPLSEFEDWQLELAEPNRGVVEHAKRRVDSGDDRPAADVVESARRDLGNPSIMGPHSWDIDLTNLAAAELVQRHRESVGGTIGRALRRNRLEGKGDTPLSTPLIGLERLADLPAEGERGWKAETAYRRSRVKQTRKAMGADVPATAEKTDGQIRNENESRYNELRKTKPLSEFKMSELELADPNPSMVQHARYLSDLGDGRSDEEVLDQAIRDFGISTGPFAFSTAAARESALEMIRRHREGVGGKIMRTLRAPTLSAQEARGAQQQKLSETPTERLADDPMALMNAMNEMNTPAETGHGNSGETTTDAEIQPQNPEGGITSPKDLPGVDSGTGTQDDPLLVSNMETAIQLIQDGKFHIKLNRPDEVSTLLDKLQAISNDARAKGEKAPLYDLCKVSVPGTNLFCAESKGIPRVKMPQFKTTSPVPGSMADSLPRDSGGEVDLAPAFFTWLRKDKKVTVEEDVQMDPSHLRASQDQLNGAKVAGIMGAMAAGTLPPGDIVVTSDGYIVDGHHRWAAAVGTELKGKNVTIGVNRIDASIMDVLQWANQFTVENGSPPQQAALRPMLAALADRLSMLGELGAWVAGGAIVDVPLPPPSRDA